MKTASPGILVWTVTLLATCCSPALAKGEAGAQFLKIGVGAKACAMGEGFSALADDPSAIFWNPAGIAQGESIDLLGMQNFWLLDMSYQYLAGTFPTGSGSFGTAIAYSSSGEIPKYENFQRIGDYTAYDAAITAAYARTLWNSLLCGIGVKFIQQKIEQEQATGFALDGGLLYKTQFMKGLSGGLVIQNIGPGIKFIQEADPLPFNIKGGLAFTHRAVTVAADVNVPRDQDVYFCGGGEYVILNALALRAGYNSAHSYTAGFGLRWKLMELDYAFAPYEDIDDSHRISLRVKLR